MGGHKTCVQECAILGVKIDDSLTWKAHIDNICAKLSSMGGLLWRIRDNLLYDMKLLYYRSFILSRITNCICVWGGAANLMQIKIRGVLNCLNHCSGRLFNKRYNTIVSYVCTKLQLAMYPHIYCRLLRLNPIAPHIICVLDDVSSSQRFYVNLPNSELFKRSFLYSGAMLWNNLPELVKNAASLNNFKFLCKKNILLL